MLVYSKTFDPKVVLCHCDLISWSIDFALYLGGGGGKLPAGGIRASQGTFSNFSYFQIMNEYDQTFNLNLLIGLYDLTLFHGSVILLYISTLNGYMVMFLSHQYD